MDEASGGDGIGDRLASDRPREPVPHLVLVREDRGTHPEHHQLFERGVLRRLPWFAPHLVPPREHARMPVATFAVLDRDAASDDRAFALEAFTTLASLGG